MKKQQAADILLKTNRENLAHLLPSFAQKSAVPTGFWAKFFKLPKNYVNTPQTIDTLNTL